ncbi:MAG: polysaccharide deacetylase family protein [Acidobacteria bacterium]|nr:MAG: polysaccharide deacetylase family protein [Acidobacteriota bacterium]
MDIIGLFAAAMAAGAATIAGAHAMVPWSQVYGENFNGIEDGAKVLALTYDDGPNDPWTMKLLEVLAKHEVSATFFMVGEYVQERPEIARAVFQAGHAIGNHGFSHRNLIFANDTELRQELEDTSKAIEDATGKPPFLFRPPFGARRPGTFKVVRQLRMFPVMWRVTCYDWSAKSHEKILKHARRQIVGGEIVLLHDGGHHRMGEDRSHTVKATDELIREYKEKGYRFTTVPEMMKMCPEVRMPDGLPRAT